MMLFQVQTHGDTAYNFGLIDRMQKYHVDHLAEEVVSLVEKKDCHGATSARIALVDWITNVTGYSHFCCTCLRKSPLPYHCSNDGTDFLAKFLNLKDVKEALSADEGAEWLSCDLRVRAVMATEVLRSVRWMVHELLPHIPILFYKGIYDIKDGVACNEE